MSKRTIRTQTLDERTVSARMDDKGVSKEQRYRYRRKNARELLSSVESELTLTRAYFFISFKKFHAQITEILNQGKQLKQLNIFLKIHEGLNTFSFLMVRELFLFIL